MKKSNSATAFLQPVNEGFIYDTARSFLQRHADPKSLLGQIERLFELGDSTQCLGLIQLLFEERHVLSESPKLLSLRAKIAFEESDSIDECRDWVEQIRLNNGRTPVLKSWNKLLEGTQLLREGDYGTGSKILSSILDDSLVGLYSTYILAHHLFWKENNIEGALAYLKLITKERPYFVKAWACLGFVYNRLGNKTLSQEAFNQCLQLERNPTKIAFYKQQLAS